jgi:hypothetical protein
MLELYGLSQITAISQLERTLLSHIGIVCEGVSAHFLGQWIETVGFKTRPSQSLDFTRLSPMGLYKSSSIKCENQ